MASFNWVDLIILLVLAHACYYGTRVGFLRLLFLFGGFFGSLFLAGWLFPHLLPIHDQTIKTVVNANLVLGFSVLVALKGYEVGDRFHYTLKGRGRLGLIESAAGVSLSFSSALVAIWLAAAAIATMPFVAFSNSVSDAFIVQRLDISFPSVPTVFAGFGRTINPNQPPEVFVKEQLNSFIGQSPLPPVSGAVVAAGKSVVRVTDFGCGGIVSGSGFMVGPGLVATAAHVIAGGRHPVIKFGSRSLEAVPVLFDQNLDFAVLRADQLQLKPLPLSSQSLAGGTDAYALGYPKGNYAVAPGLVVDELTLPGTNIYGLSNVNRDIYELKANIKLGDSGGPVVLSDGQAAGMVFGTLQQNGKLAYALTSASLQAEVSQAAGSSSRVNTGPCAL